MQDAEATAARRVAVSRPGGAVWRLVPSKPWQVLGGLIVCQWIVLGAVASSIPHNGWLYYDGGDASWYYTTAWVLTQGYVPDGSIGYGYSLLLAPLAAIAGPNRLSGLPLVVVFNAVVLAPIALLSIYGIAKQVAGRTYAFAASALWVVVPVLAIPYFYASYRHHYTDLTLPSALGLTANGDYPSMVLLLVASYFVVRLFSTGTGRDALAAGLVAGLAVAVKPANLLFLPAVFLALALARKPREAAVLAAALAPSLLTLALWKYRGLGELPALAAPSPALAAGGGALAPVGALDLDRYFDFDWEQFSRNLDGFREYTRSRRLLEWTLVAGVIALGRRSIPVATLVGVWLAVFVLAKGTRTGFDVGSGSFFTHMIAAFPAVFLLVAGLPLLVPVQGRRLVERGRAAAVPALRRPATLAIWVAGGLTVAAALLFAVLRPLHDPRATSVPTIGQYVPADAFDVSATPSGAGRVRLEWESQRAGQARVGYSIYREAADGLSCTTPPAYASAMCIFYSDPARQLLRPAAETVRTSFTDAPGPGRWVYRVAATSAPFGPVRSGDFVLLSKSSWVDVPS